MDDNFVNFIEASFKLLNLTFIDKNDGLYIPKLFIKYIYITFNFFESLLDTGFV